MPRTVPRKSDKLDAKLQTDVDICRSKLTGLNADIAALQAKIT
jgi:hypothetical protein